MTVIMKGTLVISSLAKMAVTYTFLEDDMPSALHRIGAGGGMTQFCL